MVMQAETGHKPGTCKGGCKGEGCCWVVKKGWLADAPDVRLAEGLKRLTSHNTWNQWQWGPRHPAFYDVDSFRCQICLKATYQITFNIRVTPIQHGQLREGMAS